MNVLNGVKDSEMDGAKDAKTAALIASLQGFFISLWVWLVYTAHFYSAEIDQLKKLQAAKPVEKQMEEICYDFKKLYELLQSNNRVSMSLSTVYANW